MATTSPFAPSAGATVGKTVKVTGDATPASVAGTINCASVLSSSLLVTNSGTVLVFVRISAEASPTATATDIPLAAGASRVFANPVPNGTVGLAVLPSTTTAAGVYFTPGTGGI